MRFTTLNPLTKLFAGIVVAIPLFFTLDIVSASVAVVLELVAFALVLRIPLLRLLMRIGFMSIFAVLGATGVVLYGAPSGHQWWSWGLINITDGSLQLALATGMRVLAVALPSVVMAIDIDATKLADGLAQLIHLPTRFVLGGLVALRMTQVFKDDWRMLIASRRARGVGDAKSLHSLLSASFALLVLAIRRGTQLALAMEARGFGASHSRTWARASVLAPQDWACMAMFALIGIAAPLAAVWAGTFTPVWTIG